MPTPAPSPGVRSRLDQERAVDSVVDAETEGIGVRVLVDGAWGFACDRRLDDEGARDAALRAVEFARASAGAPHGAASSSCSLAPQLGEYRTAGRTRPVEVPLDEKVALCLRAEEGCAAPEVTMTAGEPCAPCASSARSAPRRGPTSSRSSSSAAAGSRRVGGPRRRSCSSGATRARTAARARRPAGSTSRGSGWNARRRGWPRKRLALLRADPCPAGVTTVVIDAEQMQLQVHESVGHPTELDRVYGTEAAYAGTSFLRPRTSAACATAREHMNITADPTTPGGLGTFALRRRGRAGPAASRSSRRGSSPASSPPARPPRSSAEDAAARCARTAGAGCRSSG